MEISAETMESEERAFMEVTLTMNLSRYRTINAIIAMPNISRASMQSTDHDIAHLSSILTSLGATQQIISTEHGEQGPKQQRITILH